MMLEQKHDGAIEPMAKSNSMIVAKPGLTTGSEATERIAFGILLSRVKQEDVPKVSALLYGAKA